jgi:hypothetical protein
MAETEQVNVLRALQEIRVALIEADIKKSGHNDYSNYDYFELSDFLPVIQKLALEHGVICIYRLEQDQATLEVCDMENKEHNICFSIPIAELNMKGSNAIQNVGALTTYTRRYLYMIAFEIAENDGFDPIQNDQPTQKEQEQNVININQKLITKKDVNVLDAMVKKKGIDPALILGRYHVNTYEEMVFEQFDAAMKILGKMDDKE